MELSFPVYHLLNWNKIKYEICSLTLKFETENPRADNCDHRVSVTRNIRAVILSLGIFSSEKLKYLICNVILIVNSVPVSKGKIKAL